MFYSHTFLARKGPLGTVWCAAHLQHKLKKSHYISTNVPSTVERIMFPEMPIALRMSGHLLLGVVRIHSKQVDYLYEDCNEIRITINRVFTSEGINLPDDATHAPFQSVTLPKKFNLDSLELDEYCHDWSVDSHLKSQDDITLKGKIPTGQDDPYIVISFNEDDLRASSFMDNNSGSASVPMEEDVHPPMEVDTDPGSENPSPNNQLGADDINVGNRSPQEPSSIEIMRDARHEDFNNSSPILPDRAEPDKFLEEQIIKDKQTSTPVTDGVVLPEPRVSLNQNHEEQHSLGQLDSSMPFVHRTPEMELQPTPPPAAQPKVRRKRKQQFDESTVLSNEHMKNALNDTSDISRVKKNCPLSSLTIWKSNKRLKMRKEGVYYDPFITGSCADLQCMYEDNFISAKPHLVTTEGADEGTNVAQTPLSRRDTNDMEIEFLRNNDFASPDRNMFDTVMPSHNGRSYLSPLNTSTRLQSERFESTEGGGTFHTADVGTSGNLYSEMKTPDTAGHAGLSDIPELVTSPGELGFLDQDDNSAAGSRGTPELSTFSKNQETPELQQLSSRTRAVAQYLKRQSSATPILGSSEEPLTHLSLNKILEGKPTKICARMFFETLVLKNYGLVDVHQEKPYDDITLKVTSKLSKAQSPA